MIDRHSMAELQPQSKRRKKLRNIEPMLESIVRLQGRDGGWLWSQRKVNIQELLKAWR